MNKEEFLNSLRKRLNILEDSEIEDIISEYKGYIEEKVNVGLTEEEAVKELGDIDEIVRDLLAAYKVNPDKETNKVINKISNKIDEFMDSLNDKSAKDILRVLIEVIIILFLICILKIPFAMIRDLGSDVFSELANPIGNIFGGIWRFIIEFSYIIVAIIFFVKMFEKRYFKEVSTKILVSVEEETKKEETKKEKIKKEQPKKERKTEQKVIIKKEHTFVDTITDICIGVLKFFVIFIIIGIIFYLIGMTIAIGFMIYLLIKGVTYWGVLILLISLFIGGTFFLELGISFICNKRLKAIPTISKIICIILTLGIGLTISTIEISNTEIIYDSNYNKTKVTTKEIAMTDDLKLYNYDKIIIDNTLKDTIKIEYKYTNFDDNINIEIDLEQCGKGYCLYSDISSFRWNKKYLNHIIKNLKDKKIYTNDFRIEKIIYASKENADKLKAFHYYDYDEYEMEPYNFTRTYYVSSISSDESGYYNYLTINQFQKLEEIEVVKVPKDLLPNIEEKKYYEFTFEINHMISDTIEDIFKESKLISIKQTDKTGLDQIQDELKED